MFNTGPEIANRATGNHWSMIRGSGREFGFADRDVSRGFTRPGRGTGVDVRKGTRATDTRIICHACGERGHIKRMCRKKNSGNWRREQGNSPPGTQRQ